MQKIKNWLITVLLKSDGLVAVTQDWQVDYVKLASYKSQHQDAMKVLAEEYNALLKEYFELMSQKKLYEYLKLEEIDGLSASMKKEELVGLAVDAFSMSFYRD